MARDPSRRLLDQFGDAIPPEQIARLREDNAPIGGLYGRPPFSGHIAWGINPQRLASIIRAADTGSTLEWWILAEEMEELYPHYATVLGKRKRQVVQLPITVTAADDDDKDALDDAEFVRDWLKTEVLQHALFDVADAIGKGFSASEIIWEMEPDHAWPKKIVYKPQRFFEFDPLDLTTLWLRSEKGFEDLNPLEWLVHLHPAKSGMIARSGLARQVAFLWCYASFTAKDWAQFTQVYGMPPRVGRYGPEASDGDKDVLWRAVSSIAGDVAAMIPRSMELDFVNLPDKAAGAALYEKRLDWLDRTVSRLVLGGDASTSAVAGSHAVGKVHREGEDDVEKFDAFMLNISINLQIVAPMVALSRGPRKRYPILTLGRPTEIPIKDVVEALADLGGMGLKAKLSEILERLQLTPPDDNDEIVGGVKPVPPAPIDKPAIPAPARRLPEDGLTGQPAWLTRLVGGASAASAEDEAMLAALNDRLAADAAGALAGLTDEVKAEFMAASDMKDLAHRLHGLRLDGKTFGEAMARGMALAELTGQASLIDELRGRGGFNAPGGQRSDG